jgi:hypothetical protein
VVHARLNGGTLQAFSDPVRLRVATLCGREEETIAQDFFIDEVNRALVLGGAATGTQAQSTQIPSSAKRGMRFLMARSTI